jgi:outer membrane protein assembly factor BamB
LPSLPEIPPLPSRIARHCPLTSGRSGSVDRRRLPVFASSACTIAGGRVFVGSNDGRVCGLDLASGKKVWDYEAASPVTSSPAVGKGKVVVATADGQVICFG